MTITYTRASGFDLIRITYDDALEGADFITLGDITDAELAAAVAAEGGDIPGFSCRIS